MIKALAEMVISTQTKERNLFEAFLDKSMTACSLCTVSKTVGFIIQMIFLEARDHLSFCFPRVFCLVLVGIHRKILGIDQDTNALEIIKVI